MAAAASDRLLRSFATSWLDYKMTEAELARAFGISVWRVKQLRADGASLPCCCQ